MRYKRLFLTEPLAFGRHAGNTPLRVWSGTLGIIDSALESAVLGMISKQVSHEGVEVRPLDFYSERIVDCIQIQLPKSAELGYYIKTIGEDVMSELWSRELLHFVAANRGEPSYITWLIENTACYFHPNELSALESTLSFKHSEILVKIFKLNCQENFIETGVLASTELYQPIISQATIRLNQEKYLKYNP